MHLQCVGPSPQPCSTGLVKGKRLFVALKIDTIPEEDPDLMSSVSTFSHAAVFQTRLNPLRAEITITALNESMLTLLPITLKQAHLPARAFYTQANQRHE